MAECRFCHVSTPEAEWYLIEQERAWSDRGVNLWSKNDFLAARRWDAHCEGRCLATIVRVPDLREIRVSLAEACRG